MADLSRDPRFSQYARLIVEGGCNLHPGQEVVLSAPVACGEFVRLLVRQCYQSGASDVVVLYNDPALTRARVYRAARRLSAPAMAWGSGQERLR